MPSHQNRRAFVFLLLLTILSFAACGGGSAASTASPGGMDAGLSPGPDASSDASVDGGAPDMPPVAGLMMRDGIPPVNEESFVTSSVMALLWKDLEPQKDTYDWSVLDQDLALLEAAHVSNIKIRVFAGGTAPVWVKRLGSPVGFFNSPYGIALDCSPSAGAGWGGVAVQNSQGPTACIPFFWTAEYQKAYDDLMHALASRLSDPKYQSITTIVDSSCMAVYAEVFYRGQGGGSTNHTLSDAGLTPDLDWACQAAAVATHQNAFGATRRMALAINDWDLVQSTAQANGSYRTAVWSGASSGVRGTYEFVEQIARPALGDGLELQNNGLHTQSACSGGPTVSYFCYLAQYGGRHGFQTQSYVSMPLSPSGASETLLQDLDNGIALKAGFIELPNGMTAADWKLMPCYQAALVMDGGSTAPCPH